MTVIEFEEHDPDLEQLGAIALGMRDWTTAEHYLIKALRDNPESTQLKNKLFQSEIELGNIQEAQIGLRRLIRSLGEEDPQYYEALGLLGRAYKQQFMNWPDEEDKQDDLNSLRQSIRYYGIAFEKDKSKYWQGLNQVILMTILAHYEGPGTEVGQGLIATCSQIRSEVERSLIDTHNYWARASRGTLAVLDTDVERAIKEFELQPSEVLNLNEFSEGKTLITAFHVGGTLRTVKEIGQSLGTSEKLKDVTDLLSIHISKGMGLTPFEIFAEASHSPDLQRSDRHARFNGIHNLSRTNSLFKAVVRIEDPRRDSIGTGFLVAPQTIMTNYHVIPEPEKARSLTARFLDFGADYSHKSFAIKFDSSLDAFATGGNSRTGDWTLIRLSRPIPSKIAIEPIDIDLDFPPEVNKTEAVEIIQYPANAKAKIARDNVFIYELFPSDHRRAGMMWYTASTMRGSSGSPVFNSLHQLVGIHHAATGKVVDLKVNERSVKKLQVNEGVTLTAMQPELIKHRHLLED